MSRTPSPRPVCRTPLTALGSVSGTTGLLALLSGLRPIAFTATTVNVYDSPFWRSVMVHGDAEQLTSRPPGPFTTTTYPVMGVPPSMAGGSQRTLAKPPLTRSASAATAVGASGLPRISTVPRPAAFRPGPSATETSTDVRPRALAAAVRVRSQPDRETVRPDAAGTAAAEMVQPGFSNGESR